MECFGKLRREHHQNTHHKPQGDSNGDGFEVFFKKGDVGKEGEKITSFDIIGDVMLKRLRVYPGVEHRNKAQNPTKIEV